jgi:hypothetical protein
MKKNKKIYKIKKLALDEYNKKIISSPMEIKEKPFKLIKRNISLVVFFIIRIHCILEELKKDKIINNLNRDNQYIVEECIKKEFEETLSKFGINRFQKIKI